MLTAQAVAARLIRAFGGAPLASKTESSLPFYIEDRAGVVMLVGLAGVPAGQPGAW